MIILDTGGVLAALSPDQRDHVRARVLLESADASPVVSLFVLAELDYVIQRLPVDVAAGVYTLASFGTEDDAAASEVSARYADLGLGLTDASLVMLADRFDTDRILTLDERHFRMVTGRAGKPFRLLPSIDAAPVVTSSAENPCRTRSSLVTKACGRWPRSVSCPVRIGRWPRGSSSARCRR